MENDTKAAETDGETMTESPPVGEVADRRDFTRTGWGRYPIELLEARLDPFAFALYCHLSALADRGMPPDPDELAEALTIGDRPLASALETLERRKMLSTKSDAWNLTDPKTWEKF